LAYVRAQRDGIGRARSDEIAGLDVLQDGLPASDRLAHAQRLAEDVGPEPVLLDGHDGVDPLRRDGDVESPEELSELAPQHLLVLHVAELRPERARAAQHDADHPLGRAGARVSFARGAPCREDVALELVEGRHRVETLDLDGLPPHGPQGPEGDRR
jgi:hypothetical protein